MLLVPVVRRLPLLSTLLWTLLLGAALYAAVATPLDPDIGTVRGPGGRPVVSAVAFNGPAETDGVVDGDLVAGRVSRGASAVWLFLTPHRARLLLVAPPFTALTVLIVAVGWSLLLLGVVVLARSPDRPAATAFWRLSLLLAAALSLYPAAEHGLRWVLALHFVVLRLCGPALLELALVFPTGTHALVRRPLLRLLLWLPAFAVLPLYPTIVAEAHRELAWLPEVVLVAYVVGAALGLLWSRLHAQTALQRAQLHSLALGLLGGLTPPLLLTLAPQVASGRPLVPADVTLLALAALPLSVGLAIAQIELFGIALRRRTRWLLHRVAFPAGVAGVVGGLGLCVPAIQAAWRPLLPLLDAGLVAAVALLYYARRPAWARARPSIALRASDLAADRRVPVPRGRTSQASAGSRRALSRGQQLTAREIEILACAARGLPTREIAGHLQMASAPSARMSRASLRSLTCIRAPRRCMSRGSAVSWRRLKAIVRRA